MFAIKFKTENDAFADDPQEEILRILKDIQKKVENLGTGGAIMDRDGNKIGQWEFTPDDYKGDE